MRARATVRRLILCLIIRAIPQLSAMPFLDKTLPLQQESYQPQVTPMLTLRLLRSVLNHLVRLRTLGPLWLGQEEENWLTACPIPSAFGLAVHSVPSPVIGFYNADVVVSS